MENKDELYSQATGFYANSGYKEAIPLFIKCHQLDPTCEFSLYFLAECYACTNQTERAKHYYSESIKLKPNWFVPHLGLGNCYLAFGSNDEAERSFIKAIELGGNAPAYLFLGQFYCMIGRSDKAIPILEKCVSFKDANCIATGHSLLGASLFEQNRIDEALEHFKISISLDDESHTAYTGLGNVYLEKKQFIQAKECFFKSLQIDATRYINYTGLYKIPTVFFDANQIQGLPCLLKFIYHIRDSTYLFSISELIEFCSSINTPLLVFQIFNNDYTFKPAQLITARELEAVFKLTKPFRQQFFIWRYTREISHEILLSEAIISYFLGNPIRTFEIIKTELSDFSKIATIAAYYRIISADDILADDDDYDFENIAIPLAMRTLDNSSSTPSEKYYAALILLIGGHRNEGNAALINLINVGFHPASYKLAEWAKNMFSENDYARLVLPKTKEYHIKNKSYFSNQTKITLAFNEDKILDKIMPLVYFAENVSVMNDLQLYPEQFEVPQQNSSFAQGAFFCSNISFDKENNDDFEILLKQISLEKHNAVFGTENEKNKLKIELEHCKKSFASNVNFVEDITRRIYSESNTNIDEIKTSKKYSTQITNFRYYIRLVIALREMGLLNKDESYDLHKYIIYAAKTVLGTYPESEFYKFGFSEFKGITIVQSYNALNAIIPTIINSIKTIVPITIQNIFSITTPISLMESIYKSIRHPENSILPYDIFKAKTK